MSAAESQLPMTALRSLEMRSRLLPLEAQMNECVELLLSPDVAINDLLHSIDQVADESPLGPRFSIQSAPEDRRDGFFYPSRELFVQGDGGSFTCLATGIEFVDGADDRDAVASAPLDASNDDAELATAAAAESEAGVAAGPDDALPSKQAIDDGGTESRIACARPATRPIDYAAMTCESRPFPVLGFAQSEESESAYPLLLRSLSTLIELLRPRRFDALDRDVYRGLLGPAPLVDLALVLWDDDRDDDPRRPLCELSRDLAEVLKQTLESAARFPPVLHDIVCLRMNPKRFDARLRCVWRV